VRLLRTIRLDESDVHVFEVAAAPGEWAIPGGFAFARDDASTLVGRRYQAFRRGFLGLGSFGWSTLVQVAPIDRETFDALVERLAAHFVERYGAPDLAAARPVAREELAFAAAVADRPPGTLVTVERTLEEGGVRERFRTVDPARARRLRVFVPVVEEEPPATDGGGEG